MFELESGGEILWDMVERGVWRQHLKTLLAWEKSIKIRGFLGPKVWIHIHLKETVGLGHSSDHADQWGVSFTANSWQKSNYPLAHWDRFVHQSKEHKSSEPSLEGRPRSAAWSMYILLQMGDLRDKNLNHEFTTPPCSARCKLPRQQKGPHPMSLKLSRLLAFTQYGKNQQHHWDVIWFQEHCFNQQNWACEGKTDWGCHHLKLENLCD